MQGYCTSKTIGKKQQVHDKYKYGKTRLPDDFLSNMAVTPN